MIGSLYCDCVLINKTHHSQPNLNMISTYSFGIWIFKCKEISMQNQTHLIRLCYSHGCYHAEAEQGSVAWLVFDMGNLETLQWLNLDWVYLGHRSVYHRVIS